MNHPAVMTSRQRLLAAMDHQPVDHTPLLEAVQRGPVLPL